MVALIWFTCSWAKISEQYGLQECLHLKELRHRVAWPLTKIQTYCWNFWKIVGVIFNGFSRKNVTDLYPPEGCAVTALLKIHDFGRLVVTALIGDRRTFNLFCEISGTILFISSMKTILDCSWGTLSHTLVSFKISTTFIFHAYLFDIRGARDLRHCTGGSLTQCVVRMWSLEPPLRSISTVEMNVAEPISGRLLSGASSYETAVLKGPFETVPTVRMRFTSFFA